MLPTHKKTVMNAFSWLYQSATQPTNQESLVHS